MPAFASPSDKVMLAAGFTETHGIALFTSPAHPLYLVDCNADGVSVYRYSRAADVGGIVDPLFADAERRALRLLGLLDKLVVYDADAAAARLELLRQADRQLGDATP